MKKSKALILSLICTPIVTVMILFMTVFGYAYFKVSSEKNFNTNVNVDLLFHRYETTVLGNYQDALLAEKQVDDPDATNPWENPDDAPWGTEYNPFVITNPYHLQNLSRLTASGYFENFFYKNYPANSTGNDVIISAKENIPHFVVSDQNGFITVLDASDYYISPVGSAERPFIGSFRGAIVKEGAPASVTITKQLGDGTEETYTSATSAIYNLDIETHYDVVDIGLFGYVGYTIDKIEEVSTVVNETTVTATKVTPAKVSTLKDILIVDQRITSTLSAVDLTTWFSGVVEFYESITDAEGLGLLESINKHYFNYPGTYNTEGVLSGGRDFDGTYVHKDTHHIGILAGHIEYTTVENISVFYTANNICAIDIQGKGGNANYYSRTGIFGTVRNMNAKVHYDNTEGSYIVDEEGLSDKNISSGGGLGTGGGLHSGTGQGYVTATELYQWYSYTEGTAAFKYVDGTQNTTNKYKDEYGILDLWRYKIDDNQVEHFTAVPVYAYPKSGGGWDFYLDEAKQMPVKSIDEDKVVANITVTELDENGETVTETIEKTWTKFIVGCSDKASNASSPYKYTFYGKKTTDGDFEKVKYCNELSMYIMEGIDKDGIDLCHKYESNATIDFSGDLYYFYDGVFTFVLSSTEDTIEDTWENGNVDKLVLGENNTSKWGVNTAHGNQAVAAFLKSVNNNQDLNTAISKNKHIFIVSETGNVTRDDNGNIITKEIFVLSISRGSASNDSKTDNLYTMQGIKLKFDAEVADSILESYNGGELAKLPTTPHVSGGYMTNSNGVVLDTAQKLANSWGEYSILNLGSASEELSLEEIRSQFDIVASGIKDSGNNTKYNYYFENGTPAIISGTTVKDFYEWDGYIYYTRQESALNTYFTYYYQPANGGEGFMIRDTNDWYENGSPNNVLGNNYTTSQGERIYSYTTGGVTYTGPLINITSNKFHGTDTNAILSGSKVAKELTTTYNYICLDVDGKYYYSDGREVEGVTSSGTSTTGSNQVIYKATVKGGSQEVQGVLIRRYPLYAFKDLAGTSSMNIINHQGLDVFNRPAGSYYSLWSGKTPGSTTRYIGHNNEGTLVFNSDGTCYIQYSYGTVTRFLSCDSTNSRFTSANNNTSNATKFYIYTVEGTVDINYGRVTFDPIESSTHYEFAADSHVLWPTTTYRNSVSDKTNGTQSFTIKSIAELADQNWISRHGGVLTSATLHKKFQMAEATDFALRFGLGNFLGIGNAPVVPLGGPEPAYATVPQGCVGFKVNELKPGGSKIRVIVAVPTDGLSQTEDKHVLTYSSDYYFGLWEMAEEGENTNSIFGIEFSTDYINKNQPIEAFELPRSHPFDPSENPANIGTKYGNEEYILVNYGGETYRAYLNGESVLVAYEFTVNELGVYILGSTNSAMEIVYFAAEGTASEGSDGLASGQLGSVDFVYASSTKQIITVDMTQPDSDSSYNTNSYYYSSGCMLSINNISSNAVSGGYFLRANDLQLYVYRSQNSNKRYIYALSTATTTPNTYHGSLDRYLIATGDNAMLPKTDGTWNYEVNFDQLPERKLKN